MPEDGARRLGHYYHIDRLGSVVNLSDSSGDLAESYRYDAWGNADSYGAVGNPYFFTGRRYDSETGNYYYRARYYSPSIGRFLQTDPLHYYDGPNLYTYVGNNPVNWVDPWGLQVQSWWEWYLYESVVPGPYGQPVSEWNDQGPTGWGDPMNISDPAFYNLFKSEFNKNRLPGVKYFSLLELPWGPPASWGLDKLVGKSYDKACEEVYKSVSSSSGSRNSVTFFGIKPGWRKFASVIKGLSIGIKLATAFATGADAGTALYSYYRAQEKYYQMR